MDCGGVATETVGQESGHAAYGRHAYTRQVVDLPIRKALLQSLHGLPTIDESLQFRRCAQIFEEVSAFGNVFHADNGPEKRVFSPSAVLLRVMPIGFHEPTPVC